MMTYVPVQLYYARTYVLPVRARATALEPLHSRTHQRDCPCAVGLRRALALAAAAALLACRQVGMVNRLETK